MIYLDHAATSFPKSRAVTEAVQRAMQTCGNPGRGAHPLSLCGLETVYDCREQAAALFSAPDAESVVFTLNATYALNTAIKSVVRPGEHVILTDNAHNAVRRPLHRLVSDAGVQCDILDSHTDTALLLSRLAALTRKNTRAVVATHISNVDNRVLPVAEIGAFCRARGICLILDAAQSAGHIPIDMQSMQIDILCAPGHKALGGIMGCGLLLFGGARFRDGFPLAEGGSGIASQSAEMPDETPERYEAGTLPTVAIASLAAGIRCLRARGLDEIHRAETARWRQAYADLSAMRGIRLYGETPGAVLCFTHDGSSVAEITQSLSHAGICVRGGLHCAPLAHAALGTPSDGAVRISFGPATTAHDIERFSEALSRILQNR